MGGAFSNEGRVEVCLNGRWGTVCNRSREEVPEAVCARLGYPPVGMYAVNINRLSLMFRLF